jgi:hypothetical protein
MEHILDDMHMSGKRFAQQGLAEYFAISYVTDKPYFDGPVAHHVEATHTGGTRLRHVLYHA